jgi:hypothetical protein
MEISADCRPRVFGGAVLIAGCSRADFQSRVFFGRFAAISVRFSVAVLMAVGFQLLCILLLRAATNKFVIVF